MEKGERIAALPQEKLHYSGDYAGSLHFEEKKRKVNEDSWWAKTGEKGLAR